MLTRDRDHVPTLACSQVLLVVRQPILTVGKVHDRA
jgi:hypothetical protein